MLPFCLSYRWQPSLSSVTGWRATVRTSWALYTVKSMLMINLDQINSGTVWILLLPGTHIGIFQILKDVFIWQTPDIKTSLVTLCQMSLDCQFEEKKQLLSPRMTALVLSNDILATIPQQTNTRIMRDAYSIEWQSTKGDDWGSLLIVNHSCRSSVAEALVVYKVNTVTTLASATLPDYR